MVYKVNVVCVFLHATIPLNKLVHFYGLLEKNAHQLLERSHTADIVPFLKQEQDKIKEESLADICQ